MKKLFVSLLACLTIGLTACNLKDLEVEETWEYSSDELYGSKEIYYNFFENTFAKTHFTVTLKANGVVQSTETFAGLMDYTVYENGSKVYLFSDDGKYVQATTTIDYNYAQYIEQEEYDAMFGTYRSYIDIFGAEGIEGATFDVKSSGKGVISEDSEKSTGSFEATVILDNDTIHLVASEKDGLVTEVNVTYTQEGQSRTLTLSFDYTEKTIEIPNYKAWIDPEA